MTIYFYSHACPRCRQDRLVMQVDPRDGRLFLHCGECEMCWWHPSDVHRKGAGFLSLTEDFESENPTWGQVEEAGWAAYVLGRSEV